MRTCWAFILTILRLLKCFAEDLPLVNEFVIDLAVTENAKSVIESMGFRFIRKLHGFEYAFLAELPEKSFKNVSKHLSRIRRSAEVIHIEQQRQLIRTKRDILFWNDLKYPDMWYLIRASKKDHSEVDLNVQEAWQLGYSGKGVVVTIMDDGLDHSHPDLSANYAEQASWDVNNGDRDPMPNTTNPDNKHGTRCAGQVAAVGNNSVCIVGVAFNAKIGGIRMLDGTITDRVEAESLNFNQNYIDIYSGSWGPDDTGIIYEGPGRMASEAFHKGATTGRNGLGNVFVWASGNGGRRGDSCAADGYVSSIYTLAVSSVTEQNSHPWYLEKCAATMVSTYSSGGPGESGIVTTDLNHGCTNSHTGTSASAPLAVGIIALLLEANPKLTWRDVQYVIALTANPKPFKDGDFTKNGAGHLYSTYYGFGLMDAGKAVRLGELWRTLPPHHRCTTNVKQLSRNLTFLFSETYAFNFTGCRAASISTLDGSQVPQHKIKEEGEPVAYIEHIQVFMTVRYAHRGLVRVRVVSPSGTISELMPVRLIDALSEFKGLDRWPLMSVQFWGEPSAGEWKIIIDNKEGFRKLSAWGNRQPALDKATGQWESVHMVAYGTEIFPIRLKPPKETRQPPKAWFDRFARYVVSEDELSPSEYSCHSECAKNECWGPSSNQCLNGCKNYVTESGQCVASCPAGTTALISMIVMMRRNQSAELNGTRPRLGGQMNELRCERCFSACAECLRPYSAYGCTACSGDSYLAPFLSPPVSETETNLESALLLTADGDKNRVLVGSCVSRCPSGYFANDTSKTCEQCAEHCEECFGPRTDACRRCARNFRLVAGTCVDAAGPHRCPKGSFLQGNICVPCDPGCDLDSCSDYGLCTYCRFDHRFMHEGRCEGVCRPGFYPAFQLSKSGFYATELPVDFTAENGVWVCAPCPPGCARCSPSTKHVQGYVVPMCEVCQTGLILDGDAGTCHSPCPIGTYGGNCSRACHHMCSTCVNELDSCLQCSPGAYLAYGERQLNPLISFTNPKLIGYGCVIFCPEATYVARIDGERVCLPCPPLCKACSAPDKCTRCEEGYAVNELSGKCEPSPLCFHETYFDHIDGKCKPCHPSCASCRGPSPADCLDCRRLRSVLGPSPACLEPSPPVKSANANQDHQSLLEGTILQVTAGTCYLCCGAEKLLDTKPPLDCLFCLPNENTCSSWAAVGGGLGLYENFSFPDGILANSPGGIGGGWAWLTSDPIRLSFFITAVLTIGFALGCLLYQLTITHLRKHHVRDYNLLFLRGAGTGSRLSQRCPDVGNSPVISAQTTSNGLTNGRLPNQRNGDHPSSTSIYHDLLTGVSSVPGNQSLSLTTPLRLFQILHSKIDKNHARPPILTLPQTSYCKYALPFRTTKSSRSSSDKPDYLKVYTLFDDDF